MKSNVIDKDRLTDILRVLQRIDMRLESIEEALAHGGQIDRRLVALHERTEGIEAVLKAKYPTWNDAAGSLD